MQGVPSDPITALAHEMLDDGFGLPLWIPIRRNSAFASIAFDDLLHRLVLPSSDWELGSIEDWEQRVVRMACVVHIDRRQGTWQRLWEVLRGCEAHLEASMVLGEAVEMVRRKGATHRLVSGTLNMVCDIGEQGCSLAMRNVLVVATSTAFRRALNAEGVVRVARGSPEGGAQNRHRANVAFNRLVETVPNPETCRISLRGSCDDFVLFDQVQLALHLRMLRHLIAERPILEPKFRGMLARLAEQGVSDKVEPLLRELEERARLLPRAESTTPFQTPRILKP